MAKDVITRFKLETTAFDSKIKQASKELSDYSKTATKAKEGFNEFTKSNVDAARALGTMATSSTNAKQKTQELVGAFNEAAKAYNALTKEQQQSDFGKAMAQSLTQLQQRIRETKQELQGMGDTMKNSGLFGGGKLDGMLQVFGGNLMTKAAGFAASFASEIGSCVQQGIELARQGEGVRIAFERLGRGDILDGLREATHGTVTDIELMKAAVKFNDFKLPVEELGTMLAFAQQKAKDTGQSVDYMVDSIVTGLGRKSLMILDNLGLSAAEIKEKMKQTGDMTKAVGAIIREQMAKAGDYVETAADRAAQANVSLQNKMEELGRKFAPIEEASNQLWTSMKIGILDIIGGPLARLLNGLTEAGRLKNQLNDLNGGNGGETRTESMLRMLREYSGGGRGMEGKRDLYNRQVASFNQQEQQAWREANRLRKDLDNMEKQKRDDPTRSSDLLPFINDTRRRLEAAENRAKAIQTMSAQYQKGAQDIFNPKPTTNAPTPTIIDPKKTKAELDELQKVQAKISDLTKEAYTADESRQEQIRKEIAGLQEQEKKLISIKELVTGTAKGPDLDKMFPDSSAQNYNTGYARSIQAKIDSATADMAMGPLNLDSVNSYISSIKGALQDADLGTPLYESLTEKLKDATTMSTLLQELMERGLQGADLESTAQALKEKLLSPEGIDQTAIQSFLEELNRQIEEAGGVGLKLNADTGEVTDDKGKGNDDGDDLKKFNEGIGKLSGGLSQVTGGLKAVGVEIPKEVDQVLGVINGVSQIISGVGTIISIFGTTAITANTTAVGLNTAAIGGLIAALEFNSATNFFGLANGGIVPAFAHGGLIGRAAAGMMIPGNSMSGDNLRLPVDGGRGVIGVNSGELILNKSSQNSLAASLLQAESLVDSISDYRVSLGNAQQMSLASEMEGGAAAAENTQPFINGEMIYLGLQAYMRRSGLGEIVTAER